MAQKQPAADDSTDMSHDTTPTGEVRRQLTSAYVVTDKWSHERGRYFSVLTEDIDALKDDVSGTEYEIEATTDRGDHYAAEVRQQPTQGDDSDDVDRGEGVETDGGLPTVDPDDVEGREDWDPALEPEGFTPDTAPDGRSYHVAAWDGGVSDLCDPAPNVHDMTDGAPAVLTYLSNQGTVVTFEGTLLRDADARQVHVEADDGSVRAALYADMDGRPNVVQNADGRHLGTMLDVRLARPWDVLAEHYGFPEGVEAVYEVASINEDGSEVQIAIERTRDAANEARSEWSPAIGSEQPEGFVVRKLTDDDNTRDSLDDDSDDDSDDEDTPEVRTDGGTDESSDVRDARSTPVDGGIIHDVARSAGMGAGGLKATLESLDGPDDLDALDARPRKACRTALEQHGAEQRQDVHDAYHAETLWSDEFGQAVNVEDVHPPTAEEVLRGDPVAVTVQLEKNHYETTGINSLVTEQPDADGLERGDLLRLPDSSALHIEGVAPADEAPESARDGPLYQAVLRRRDASAETYLYGPHNIQQALEAGAIYAGASPTEERRPFWCDGCGHPHQAEERRDDPLLDAETCSYGCAERVSKDRLAARMEDRA